MNTDNPTVPSGITHDPDLSNLSYDERMAHYAKALRPIAFYEGANGVAAFKAKHPEAERVFTPIRAGASVPKPPGYYPAWRKLVALWLTDTTALARTLGQDVDWLNAEIGSGRFDPGRYLSKDLSATERKLAAELFSDRGLPLPEAVRSKADVKKAAKAGKAKAQPGAMPFGDVGTRTGDTLVIGQRTFRVELYKGRECVRVTADGLTQRIYLSHLLALLTVGETTGDSLPTLSQRDRELVSCPNSASSETSSSGEPAPANSLETSSSGELATPNNREADPANLHHRVSRLTAEREAREQTRAAELAAIYASGRDPLDD